LARLKFCDILNKMKLKFFMQKVIPAVLWVILIFLLSAVPGGDYPPAVFDYGIIAHLVEFFVLGYLLARALGGYSFKNLCLSLVICLLYALSDEFHQAFVPYRSVSMVDWLVDVFGSTAGIFVYYKRNLPWRRDPSTPNNSQGRSG